MTYEDDQNAPTDERILRGAIAVLARDGVAGLSMRAVATEAGVAVGLANYHFKNKDDLMSAALEHVGRRDLDLVSPPKGVTNPVLVLRECLRSALDPTMLTREYLSLRLQLWSLAGVDARFADINRRAQRSYLDAIIELLRAANPNADRQTLKQRAADILIVQNGVWLSAILILDTQSVDRALARCEELAFIDLE